MRFCSELAKLLRAESLIFMQQAAYCDESGKHDQAECFVMSGMVTHDWDRLSDEWSSALKDMGIQCFHAADCEKQHGEFEGLSLERCEAIQDRLIRVMIRSKIPAVTTFIRRDGYEAVKHRLRTVAKYKSIYFLGFEAAIVNMLHLAKNSEVAFIFDRQREYQGRAKELYDLLTQHPTFPHASRLGALTFEAKDRAIPLQAVDLFAYESYRRITDLNSKPRWQMRLLNQMKPRPRLSHINKSILERLADSMEKYRSELD